MAGLGVVLESHKNFNQSRRPQIISKTTLVSSTQYNFSSPSSSHNSPMASLCTSSFLQRCFLCHKELKDGMDIYMYRGDRAFCSAECRCRHIFADEDGGKNFAYLLS